MARRSGMAIVRQAALQFHLIGDGSLASQEERPPRTAAFPASPKGSP